jgi:hypothetical protein
MHGPTHTVVQMEVSVNERAFDVPVFVRSGEHYVQEICSLDDALDFLEEWPRNRQGPIYETALRACHRAYCRDVPIGVARDAFIGFAKSAGIHERVETLLPFPAISKSGRGDVSP